MDEPQDDFKHVYAVEALSQVHRQLQPQTRLRGSGAKSTRGLRNAQRHNAAPSAVVATLDLKSPNAFTFKMEVSTL